MTNRVKAAAILFVVMATGVIANVHYQQMNEMHAIAVQTQLTQIKTLVTLQQILAQGAGR